MAHRDGTNQCPMKLCYLCCIISKWDSLTRAIRCWHLSGWQTRYAHRLLRSSLFTREASSSSPFSPITMGALNSTPLVCSMASSYTVLAARSSLFHLPSTTISAWPLRALVWLVVAVGFSPPPEIPSPQPLRSSSSFHLCSSRSSTCSLRSLSTYSGSSIFATRFG